MGWVCWLSFLPWNGIERNTGMGTGCVTGLCPSPGDRQGGSTQSLGADTPVVLSSGSGTRARGVMEWFGVEGPWAGADPAAPSSVQPGLERSRGAGAALVESSHSFTCVCPLWDRESALWDKDGTPVTTHPSARSQTRAAFASGGFGSSFLLQHQPLPSLFLLEHSESSPAWRLHHDPGLLAKY